MFQNPSISEQAKKCTTYVVKDHVLNSKCGTLPGKDLQKGGVHFCIGFLHPLAGVFITGSGGQQICTKRDPKPSSPWTRAPTRKCRALQEQACRERLKV